MEEKNYVKFIDIGLTKIDDRKCEVYLQLYLYDRNNGQYTKKSVMYLSKRDICTTSDTKRMHIITIFKTKFEFFNPQKSEDFLIFLRHLTALFLRNTNMFKNISIRYEIETNEVIYINNYTKEIVNNDLFPSVKNLMIERAYRFNRSIFYDKKEVEKFNEQLMIDNSKLKLYEELFHFVAMVDLDQINGGK